MAKVKIQIFKGELFNSPVEGQLLIIDGSPCIIPVENRLPNSFDDRLEFDGHHISREVDSPLWVNADSVQFVMEEEVVIE